MKFNKNQEKNNKIEQICISSQKQKGDCIHCSSKKFRT